jgi:hypothetical protein
MSKKHSDLLDLEGGALTEGEFLAPAAGGEPDIATRAGWHVAKAAPPGAGKKAARYRDELALTHTDTSMVPQP